MCMHTLGMRGCGRIIKHSFLLVFLSLDDDIDDAPS